MNKPVHPLIAVSLLIALLIGGIGILDLISKDGQRQSYEEAMATSQESTDEINEDIKVMQEKLEDFSNPKLKVNAWNWGQSSESHFSVRGEVENISEEVLDDVMVLVRFKDKSGQFVSSEDVFIDYRQLLPGQSSPFEVIGDYNPAVQKATIEFKTFDGKHIAYEDKT